MDSHGQQTPLARRKVLVVTGIYPPSLGGPATYSVFLEKMLPQYGFDVVVLSFDEVRRFPKILRHVLFIFKILSRARGTTHIYAQDPVSVGVPTMIASKILRRKYILKIVGDYAWEQGIQRSNVKTNLDTFVKEKSSSNFVNILKFVEKRVAIGAWRIVTPSEYLKRIVVAWGIDKDKIFVIHNAVETLPHIEEREALRKKFSLNDFTIFTSGRLVPWKGFSVVIESMKEVLKVNKNAMLFIAGDGPSGPDLKKLICAYGMEEHVVLIGPLDRQTHTEFAKASDVFILNSEYEGLSHVLLEMLYLEVPILASDAGGNPEIIVDGRDGVLFKYNDLDKITSSIISIMNDRKNSRMMAKGALRRLNEFSPDKTVEKLISIF